MFRSYNSLIIHHCDVLDYMGSLEKLSSCLIYVTHTYLLNKMIFIKKQTRKSPVPLRRWPISPSFLTQKRKTEVSILAAREELTPMLVSTPYASPTNSWCLSACTLNLALDM